MSGADPDCIYCIIATYMNIQEIRVFPIQYIYIYIYIYIYTHQFVVPVVSGKWEAQSTRSKGTIYRNPTITIR